MPDPRKKAPAENLGRTMEPLLWPERVSDCADPRKFIPWLIGRLPIAGQLVAVSGMIHFFAVTSATAKVTLGWARNYQTVRLAPVPRPAPIPCSRNLARQAELVVRQFLDASTIEEKAALVVNARKTKRWMNEWYRRRPGGSSQTNAIIGEPTQGFYAPRVTARQ